MQRRTFLAGAACGAVASLAGCVGSSDDGTESPAISGETLTLATTTSTYDTGLLGEINQAFEERFGAGVDAVAQGTGAALETGRRGDSDLVMVHARSLEDEFIRKGYGINRREIMFNDFVVVGPEADPASIDGLDDVTAAFETIAESESVFISRGDNSGTHTRELEIWRQAGIEPGGEWYREVGSGMGEVLNQANLTPGYALADRGTYLSQRSQLDISIRVEGPIGGGPELLANPYGIVAVNPAIHDNVNYDLAMAYIGFLTSREGKNIIDRHEIDDEQLFFPRAVSEDPNFQQYVPENWSGEE